MTTIRHRKSKLGWLHVLSVALLLLGFGLTSAGPGGVANAARHSGGGGGGMRSEGASSGGHGRSAFRSMSSRSRSFSPGISSRSSRGSTLSHSSSSGGLRTRSFDSSSLHMRGLTGIGSLDYRPLTTRSLIGPRPVHEPQPQSHVASPIIRGGSGRDVVRFRSSRDFGRDHDTVRFSRSVRDRSSGRFGNDRFFDFGRYDHYRDSYRFDRDDFARFHCYGFYRFRFPTIVAYNTFLFPDEFLFGDWFGSDVCWWSGNVVPSAGVTVILVF